MFTTEDRNKYLLSVKKELQKKVEAIKANFLKNPSGIESVQAYTQVIDNTLSSIYKTFSDNFFKKNDPYEPALCVMAIGGYGRGELNFHSDIDLLFLFNKKSDPFTDYMTGSMLPFLWDIGLEIGHSSRSISDCLAIARQDMISLTSLMESRPIAGNEQIYSKFRSALKKYLKQRGVQQFIFNNIDEKKLSDEKQLESIFISEPDLKESPGGLRDVHSALWSTRTVFSSGSLDELLSKNIIDEQEYNSLKNSLDLFFKIRNAMHLHTGKKYDVLAHELQKKMTEMLGYASMDERSGLENFMRDYYAAAYNAHVFSNILFHRCRSYRNKSKIIFALFRLKKLGSGFVRYKNELSLKDFNENFFAEKPELLLSLFKYVLQLDLKLSESIKRVIRKNLPLLKEKVWKSGDVKRFFFDLLKSTNSSRIFRAMNEIDLLGIFLPEFGKCKFQIHNDFFHLHTVDEHCLQSVEKLETLAFSPKKELVEISTVYGGIEKKEILKLSLLLHDTGKAEGVDHVETGLVYVENIAKRLDLGKNDAEILKFLMKNHLLMNKVAQRRDLSDNNTIIEFAEKVNNIERLKMLYVHTCADIMAVSPAMWTEWKGALLWELYHKTYDYLMVDDSVGMDDHEIADNCKKEVLSLPGVKSIEKEFVNYFLNNMPARYFMSLSPDKVAKHIAQAKELEHKNLTTDYSRDKRFQFWEISVCSKGKLGTLSKITGVLSSRSLNILNAQVYSGKDGFAIDILQVSKSEKVFMEDKELLAKTAKDLESVFSGEKEVSDIMKSRRLDAQNKLKGDLLILTTVTVDNEVSENHTVIEVIFQDRIGSLYLLTKTFSDSGINIVNAKISTDGKRGFDVFYVLDRDGRKILDIEKIKTIKSHLEKCLK